MRLLVGLAWMAALHCAVAQDTGDWPGYLGGPDRNQYSALDRITPDNAGELEVAWVYRSGGGAESNRSQIQCNPIVVDGVLYATSPGLKLFALDAATGLERWVFDPFEDGGSPGGGVNRGVTYWAGGGDIRILYVAGAFLYSVDAETGEADTAFGDGGRVSLKEGLGRDPESLFVGSNSPGAIYGDLIVMGTRVSESLPSAPGHIRAYNVRTGALVWTFHTIPQPGEFGYETWPADSWEVSGGANAWAGMSVDPVRGVVYVPTGSAAYDFYGGDRAGDNLFANTILALDAATGKRLWHYQVVRHDLWDRDLPAPPNLVTVEHEGKRVDALAQITKSAHVFLLDRDTGEPLFPIEEVVVAASDLKGERSSRTQPVPTQPPPFGRQAMTEENVTDISPEAHDFVLDRLKRSKTGAQFIPPSREGTVIFPGFDGGGEWGGAAADPETGILYVNASEMPWILTMIDFSEGATRNGSGAGARVYAQYCVYCHGVDRKGDPLEVYPSLIGLQERASREEVRTVIREGRGMMPSMGHIRSGRLDSLLAYLLAPDDPVEAASVEETGEESPPRYGHTGYLRFVDREGYPAIKPPWGTLNAIDLNTGELLWKVVLGETPELAARGIPQTGTENYGGPAITKGGVLFIAATKDEKFRAFDMRDGSLLYETDLPAGGYATPSVYAVDGRQFVVIACGGGKMGTDSGDSYVAFALP